MFYLQVLLFIGAVVGLCAVFWWLTATYIFDRNLKVLDKIEEYKVYSSIPPTYHLPSEDYMEVDEITQPYLVLPTMEVRRKNED